MLAHVGDLVEFTTFGLVMKIGIVIELYTPGWDPLQRVHYLVQTSGGYYAVTDDNLVITSLAPAEEDNETEHW